ncbi:glycosyltransferase [Faecalispora jeddahensis]|uniref:glycosyltransferase n=1 Tax=Faecalispora jeddahensis TaxID=1414721 RepID=UPI0027BA2AF6|nr:glycosyltransferase [Faecalispora jeddahensis]
MKIAIFTETYLPQTSAVETQVLLLAQSLIRLGHEVLVVSTDVESEECYLEQHTLFGPAKPSDTIYGQTGQRTKLNRLKEFIDDFDPDVIHLFTFCSVGGLGLKYALSHDLPLITTVQSTHDISEGFYGRGVRRLLGKRLCQSTYRKALAFSDLVTSPSQKILRKIRPLCKHRQLTVSPLCVDTEQLREKAPEGEKTEAIRRRLGITGKTGVLFVGTLGKDNGVDTLLDHWAALCKGQNKLHLAIVGTGPQFDELKNKANLLGISTRVTFAGEVPREQIPLCYQVCSAFFSASESDAMKAAPLEAIVSGLPVILPKNSACAELLVDGVNGFAYDPETDIEKILHNFASLSPEKEAAMKKLVARTMGNLTLEEQAKSFLSFYALTQKHHYKTAEKLE